MHNLGFQGRKYAQPRIYGQQYAQSWIPGPEVCTTPDSRPAVCRRLHTFGERLQTKASSCDPLRAGWQFDRVINADRASSCNPHGRGLDAQPWIPGPAVCRTPDPMAGSMKYADVCKHLENVCKPRPAAAIPCGPVLDAVPSMDTRGTYLQFPRVISADRASSCDPLRAGWQFDRVINADRASSCNPHGRGLDAQPWILGPEVCTTPDPMAGSMKYADVCKHLENVCKPRPAAAIPCGPVGSSIE
jgi:hypothetical protein